MEAPKKSQVASGSLGLEKPADDTLLIVFYGQWTIELDLPSAEEVRTQLQSNPNVQRITFDTTELTHWDSGLLTFLIKVMDFCRGRKIQLDSDGLPHGVKRLLALASAVPEKKDTGREGVREAFLPQIGSQVIKALSSAEEMLAFIGEAALAFVKLLAGRARLRRSDLVLIIQECGVDALPIVTLISVLIGLILAFVGAVQLKLFGAEIYIASLVAIGMTREMGAMMAAIIMAGRTGAAFAAQLGTMQVNEEIDALKTLGIAPMEFLVLPRMLALVLMMPMLCLYADLMGILGGLIVVADAPFTGEVPQPGPPEGVFITLDTGEGVYILDPVFVYFLPEYLHGFFQVGDGGQSYLQQCFTNFGVCNHGLVVPVPRLNRVSHVEYGYRTWLLGRYRFVFKVLPYGIQGAGFHYL